MVGAHISSGGSFPGAVEEIHRLGGNALQVFSRNPRGGRARQLGPEESNDFRRARAHRGVAAAVLHAPYTVNLASATPQTREFGTRVVGEDLVRGAALGVELVVMHPGSHGGAGIEEGLRLTAVNLLEARRRALDLSDTGKLPALVLENMSGSGTELGGCLWQLGLLLELVDGADWLGFCLDTAHAHGAGYDLSTAEGRERLLADWQREVGFERMWMVHLNDSLVAAGSRRDRHALLGDGQIGAGGLRELLREPILRRLPLIVESPVQRQQDYRDEIAKVRGWAGEGSVADELQ